jgi:hypothetical protein
MPYTKLDPQISRRDEALAYDDVGPGLYADETAVELDTGELVAASVSTQWMANGGGIAVTACARWIDSDGQTQLCGHAQHIEVTSSHSFDAGYVALHGAAALSRDVLMLVLGEETTIGTWSEEVKLNTSIRRAITCVGEAAEAADAGALL